MLLIHGIHFFLVATGNDTHRNARFVKLLHPLHSEGEIAVVHIFLKILEDINDFLMTIFWKISIENRAKRRPLDDVAEILHPGRINFIDFVPKLRVDVFRVENYTV